MRAVAVRQGALRGRADPRYLRMSNEVGQRYAAPAYPLVPLGTLLAEAIIYGTSDLLQSVRAGFPTLRMNNITADGWNISDIKYLDCDRLAIENLLLQRDDILVNRTNGSLRLVGKAARFDFDGDWLFASYLLRLRVDRERADPTFITFFLNSPAGRLQIERLARPIAMINISPPELRSILIPLPPSLAVQRQLVRKLSDALEARVEKKQQARRELLAVGDDLLELAGVSFPTRIWPHSYGVTGRDLARMGSLGAHTYHPERVAAVETIRAATSATPHPIDALAELVSDKHTPDSGQTCLGLSGVAPDTGELLPEREESADAKLYQRGDVLYCRLRPYLNKVHRAEESGLCSTEFYVLRPKPGIDPDWLACALRSRTTLAQTVHLQTGNTHPRVPEADFRKIWLPLLDREAQNEVARRLVAHRKKAAVLQAKADRDWEAAEEDFDSQLLG